MIEKRSQSLRHFLFMRFVEQLINDTTTLGTTPRPTPIFTYTRQAGVHTPRLTTRGVNASARPQPDTHAARSRQPRRQPMHSVLVIPVVRGA
ncbi:hypothetical protein S40285_10489 [Stachybotrys chlorohalonatus IBT 40285]|uniref:Uncharacterized protein n=1 Tax=Stachybotrys chlorohalonatus (strain IBT 40285) TaxID=1283841 RepID=A0A084QXC9_STAC4|nr:hypothetical protein S40285_10489 [Stachybotrys chlorohalonata IBT 40285]